jgi:hypothetical protein
VVTDGPVRYGFAVMAGPPGTAPQSNAALATPLVWPASPAEPWYVVQATGDLDADGVLSVFVSSSFSGEVYEENESE